MTALEYSKWELFVKVINKAKISCNLSGVNVNDHFPVKGKIVKSGATKPTKNLNANGNPLLCIVLDNHMPPLLLRQLGFHVLYRNQL